MARHELIEAQVTNGTWVAHTIGPCPSVELDGTTFVGERLDRGWHLRVPLPARLICDGAQALVLQDVDTGETLDRVSVITGAELAGDLRAEVAQLRAELDIIKAVLRDIAAR